MLRDALEFAPSRLSPWPRNISRPRRMWAFMSALTDLLLLDVYGLFGFDAVRQAVVRVPFAKTPVSYDALALVRVAVRDACVFYVKPVACLQRSAVVTRMLRRRGVGAQLVVGYGAMPVRCHAWVEVDGEIVWDRTPGIAHYRVLDRI